MLFGRSCAAVVCLGLVCATAAPQAQKPEPVLFRWKLEKGEALHVEVSHAVEQTARVMGQTVTTSQTHTYRMRLEPLRTNDKGQWTLRARFTDWKVTIDIGGNKIDNTKEPNPLSDFTRAFLNEEFFLTLSPSMSVLKVEVPAVLARRLAANQAGIVEGIVVAAVSEDRFKEMTSYFFGGWPKSPMVPGQSWNETTSLDLGFLGKCSIDTKFTYAGAKGGLDRILTRAIMKFPGNQNAIKKNGLKTTQSDGWLHFDRTKGRVTEASRSGRLEGEVIVEVSDMEIAVHLDQRHKTTVRFLDP